MTLSSSPRSADRPDRRVLRCVRQAALAGVALVLVWPAARGHSEWIGWLPMWLGGLPLDGLVEPASLPPAAGRSAHPYRPPPSRAAGASPRSPDVAAGPA